MCDCITKSEKMHQNQVVFCFGTFEFLLPSSSPEEPRAGVANTVLAGMRSPARATLVVPGSVLK